MHERMTLAPRESQSAQDPTAGAIEQIDRRPKCAQIPLEGPRHQQSHWPGAVKTNALGNQFAQNNMQNRQQQKCHANRNQVNKNSSMPPRNDLKQRTQERRERGFTE